MNAETKLLKKIVRAISHNPENIRDYNWIEITNEFDYETMDRLICEIKYDFVVDEVVSCILSAWDDALQHRDPRCLVPDSRHPQINVAKYRGEHSLEYELNNIKKTRILEKDLKKEEDRPLPSPFPDDNNNPNNQLGQHNIQQSAPADTGEIEKLKAEIEQISKKNGELEAELKEARTIPSTITALQKVRMELARQLLLKAGANLEKWGNKDKAGTVMSTMLGNIPASTCKTYVSDHSINKEFHKENIDEINKLLESLELDFRL